MKKVIINLCLMLFCIAYLGSCKDSENEKSGRPYDPSKPTELLTFYPDSGRYLEKIILTGNNLGNDPSQIKVYFNKKRAAVVGSTGNKMYTLAPRLPGDMCDLSVVIGTDSLVYPNKFKYKTSISVTTIAGNGNSEGIKPGSLAESALRARFICVDKDDNIFGLSRCQAPGQGEEFTLFRINEEEDELSILGRGLIANVPGADPTTGVVTFPTEDTPGSFISLNPIESWGPRFKDAKWKDPASVPPNGWKHCMVVNPGDGCIYMRYVYGGIIKVNPKTYETEVIGKTPNTGDSYGLTFRPNEPNILYISMLNNCGDFANSICTIDVTNPLNTFKRITSSIISGGHRDGELHMAQFNNPQQIFSDADSNIYVADAYNHCIRRIRPDGIVETVVGIPGTSGWKDGNKEDALFDNPTGVGVSSDGSVYVADWNNARVRKLSIN